MDLKEDNKVSNDYGLFILSIIACIGMFFFNICYIFYDPVPFDVFFELFKYAELFFTFFIFIVPFALICYIFEYKNSSKKSKIKSYLIYFSPLICIIIMILFSFVTNMYFSYFSPNKWFKCENARHLMLDDLTSKYRLTEMNETNILKLLGKPNHEDSIANTKQYIIGPVYIDDADYLLIEFDKNNKVINYEVRNIDF